MTDSSLTVARNRHRPGRIAGMAMGLALGLMIGTAAQAQQDKATFSLAPADNAVALDTITVTSSTASGYAIDVQNAPASVSIVTGEEIEGKAYRDVRQALRNVPGVYVTSSQGLGGTGGIRLRGLDAKYTLVMVDGIPQGSRQAYYNGYGTGAEFGWLPPTTAIERIEVIRGPMSTIYGSAALGGVVNIITKPVADEWHGSFSAGTTFQENPDSGNYHQSSFRISGPLIDDVLGLRFNAGVFKRDEDNIPNGYSDYLRRNANVGLDWVVSEGNKLTFEIGFGRADSESNPNESATWSTRGAGGWSTADFRTERERQTIRHTLDWGERWTTKSYIQREEVNQFDSSYHSAYERITANTQTVLPFRDHLFTIGTRYRLQRTENPDRGKGEGSLERWDAALFAEHQWFMTDAFTLTWGLRYVYDENYGSELVPRVYGAYKITPQLTLKGGVSAGYITPDLKQGDSNWIEGACGGGNGPGRKCIIVGNSDLSPESSMTYELGLNYRNDSGLRGSLTFFHTDFTNKIGREFICDQAGGCIYHGVYARDGVKRYINIAEAKINGVEFALSVPLTETLDLSTSYTYTDSKRESGPDAGYPLSQQPEHLVTLGLDWDASASTNVWLKARYQSETLETPSSHGNANESNPGYAMVDIGANYQFDNGFELYGGVYNLLDKDITEEEFDRVLDGRRYNIGVRYSF